MNKLLTTAAFAMMCVFGTYAQQVIVTNTEGVSTKFSANRVESITFTNVEDPTPETIQFVTAEVSGSSSSVYLTLTEESGNFFETYISSANGVTFLSEGVFTPDPYNSPMTFDSDNRYTFYKEGETSTGVKSGTITVSRAAKIYTIVLDLVLEDERSFKGQYVGELPNYSPILTAECSSAEGYDNNGRVAGEYYVKMHDVNWNWDIVFDFYADPTSTTLPAGVYTYSDTPAAGNYGPKSSISCYGPNFTLKPASPITVAYDGSDIEISGVFNDEVGREITVHYKGAIEFPDPILPDLPEVTFSDFKLVGNYGRNITLEFTSEDGNTTLQLDTYRPDKGVYLDEGVYTINSSSDGFTVSTDVAFSFVKFNTLKEDDKVGFRSGTMTVSREEAIYTVLFDITLVDGRRQQGSYVGELAGLYQPENGILLPNPSDVKILSVNNQLDGEFYLKLNDKDYVYEMVLDLYADASATTLPAGRYNVGKTRTAGNLYSDADVPSSSSITLYIDYHFTSHYAEGSYVDVSYDGDDIVLDIHLVLTYNGKEVDLEYKGTLKTS